MDYDIIKEDLLSVTDSTLKHARSLDAQAEFEIFLYFEQAMEAKISQGIVTAKDGSVAGNAVRAAIGKRVGFACASGITAERVKFSIEEAYAIAKSVDAEDSRFKGFADPQKAASEGRFEKKILELGTGDLIKSAQTMVDEAAQVDDRARILEAETSASWGGYSVGNTRGVEAATRFGSNGAQMSVQAIQGDERRGSFDFDVARDRLFDTEGLGRNAARKAVSLLGAEKLDFTGKMPTVWTPIPAALYLVASIGRAVLGEEVVNQVSPLCDMIGDTVATKEFTIVDNGQSPHGLGTRSIDHEGLPQRTNHLVDEGVLKGFLFNTYFARVHGVEATGNCERGSSLFGGGTPYEDTIGVSFKHLEVSPGKRSREQIIEAVDGRAILLDDFLMGIFHTDVATGEFSVVANNAYLIEDGEVKHPVQPLSIGGHFYKGLKNLQDIGNDVEVLPFAIEAPTLVFDGFTVVG